MQRSQRSLAVTVWCAALLAPAGVNAKPAPCADWDAAAISQWPSARQFSAMAYDSARAVMVNYGGIGAFSAEFDNTSEWNGTQWTFFAAPDLPGTRYGHAMAYDSVRGVVVMFGGRRGAQSLGDTWEWNGAAWSLVATDGPPARVFHSMVFDAGRGVTVLFGGAAGAGLTGVGDLWEWDGAAWTEREIVGPSARSQHAMAYDANRGVTVLFGGASLGIAQSDTWEYDGAKWAERPAAGPAPRTQHAMAYDSARRRVVLQGGYDGALYHETWTYDGGAWTDLAALPPTTRWRHSMAYDSARDRVVIFGGQHSTDFDQGTWLLFDASPGLASHPQSQAVAEGAGAAFSVGVVGAQPFQVQWRKDGKNLSDGGSISGAGTANLVVNPASPGDAGMYDAVVTNDCGLIVSAPAALVVTALCPADLDGDGQVGSSDLATLLGSWGGCP